MSERKKLFDNWAESYDATLENTAGFPFEGYERVLAEVVSGAGVGAGASVLDVGTGTGALVARFAALGCRVLGVDLSEEMLGRARKNVPTADFGQLDLLGDWSSLDDKKNHFDAVVSAYVMHEFVLATKLELLTRFADLLKPGGRVVIGDISFQRAASRDAAYRQWQRVWDETEYYWVAEEALPRLEQAGFGVRYRQLSFCGGVYILTKRVASP